MPKFGLNFNKMKSISTFSNACFIASFFIALSGSIRGAFAHFNLVAIDSPNTITLISLVGAFFGTLLMCVISGEIASKWAKRA